MYIYILYCTFDILYCIIYCIHVNDMYIYIYTYIYIYIYLVGPENSTELFQVFYKCISGHISLYNTEKETTRLLDSVFDQFSTTWLSGENLEKTQNLLSPASPTMNGQFQLSTAFLPIHGFRYTPTSLYFVKTGKT